MAKITEYFSKIKVIIKKKLSKNNDIIANIHKTEKYIDKCGKAIGKSENFCENNFQKGKINIL